MGSTSTSPSKTTVSVDVEIKVLVKVKVLIRGLGPEVLPEVLVKLGDQPTTRWRVRAKVRP